jgi:hypothetical protein
LDFGRALWMSNGKTKTGGVLTQESPLGERKIFDGNVVLFQRKNSKRWQARIKLQNSK